MKRTEQANKIRGRWSGSWTHGLLGQENWVLRLEKNPLPVAFVFKAAGSALWAWGMAGDHNEQGTCESRNQAMVAAVEALKGLTAKRGAA